MNIIASSGGSFILGPILALIIAAVAVYFLLKVNKLSQAIIAASCVGAVMCIVEGVNLLDRNHETLPIAGAILIAAGLGVFVSVGLGMRSSEDK